MKTCHNCACDPVCNHTWNGWETCGNWIQKPEKPLTNADHIRAMSDEELAKSRVIDYEGYPGTYLAIDCEKVFYSEEEAIAAELEWLQQPAEEGE